MIAEDTWSLCSDAVDRIGTSQGAFVSHRTIAGTDEDFAAAIRRATQERPDILLVTGLEAAQPLRAAVLAAAGGRLVIAGVVASTTVEALRMLAGQYAHVPGLWPPHCGRRLDIAVFVGWVAGGL